MDVMSIALGGIEKAQGTFEKAAARIAKAADPAGDMVDLSTEMVSLLAARNQYQSNARVIHTGDDMQKTLLNLLA